MLIKMPPATCHCLTLCSSLFQLGYYKHPSHVSVHPSLHHLWSVSEYFPQEGAGHIRNLLSERLIIQTELRNIENWGNDFIFVEKACYCCLFEVGQRFLSSHVSLGLASVSFPLNVTGRTGPPVKLMCVSDTFTHSGVRVQSVASRTFALEAAEGVDALSSLAQTRQLLALVDVCQRQRVDKVTFLCLRTCVSGVCGRI